MPHPLSLAHARTRDTRTGAAAAATATCACSGVHHIRITSLALAKTDSRPATGEYLCSVDWRCMQHTCPDERRRKQAIDSLSYWLRCPVFAASDVAHPPVMRHALSRTPIVTAAVSRSLQ